jgi:hypothetical protein
MAVGVEGDLDVRVAEALADDLAGMPAARAAVA